MIVGIEQIERATCARSCAPPIIPALRGDLLLEDRGGGADSGREWNFQARTQAMSSQCHLLLASLLLPSLAAAELGISGVDDDVERNIRAFASLASEPCDADERVIRRRFRALESETRKALEPFGYYNPELSLALARDDSCWHAAIDIAPGDPVLLRNVDIRVDGPGSADPEIQALIDNTILAPGRPLRHAEYDRLKRNLQIRAADRGYLAAGFAVSRLDVWPDQGTADIELHILSGPRYRIGEIDQDQDFLDPSIVAAYLDLDVGEPYDSADIVRAHRDLSDSAYFGHIDIRPDLAGASGDRVPVRIALKPGDRIEYTVGVGVSTDTGPRFRAGFRNNRINRRGHRLIAELGTSPVLQGLSAEYRIPLADPRREWFSLAGAAANEETDTFDSEQQRLGLRWTRAMSGTWLRTVSVDASNESFHVGETVDTSRAVIPGIMFDQKLADRDVFPLRGRRLGVELRGTDEALGSTMTFLQASVWMRWIRSFGTGNRVLFRLNGGVTESRDFTALPPSVRFFAGGDVSVRGFDYNSLGPKDADGNVIGGNNLLVASIEYERHLKGNYYGAVFVDAGNAFDDTDFEAEVGAGIGIKWRSPLGPIRLYLGYPLTEDDESVRVHLRLGADL